MALIIAGVSLIAMAIYNTRLALIYIILMSVCFAMFKLFKKDSSTGID
jgi:hypothetical protein